MLFEVYFAFVRDTAGCGRSSIDWVDYNVPAEFVTDYIQAVKSRMSDSGWICVCGFDHAQIGHTDVEAGVDFSVKW